jgi:hypothetical protein
VQPSIASLLLACACVELFAQHSKEGQFKSLLKQGFDLHQQAHFVEAIPVLERAQGQTIKSAIRTARCTSATCIRK